MLYHLVELSSLAMAPARLAMQGGLAAIDSGISPFQGSSFERTARATLDSALHLARRFGKPSFGHETTLIDGVPTAVRERVVMSTGWCDLLRFERAASRPDDPRLLVVAPMSGHYATLLRGTVEAFLPDHDVYITDWQDARMMPVAQGVFGLDDFITAVILQLRTLGPGAHVVAVCQPSVPVMAAIAIMSAIGDPCTPASMTLIGGPVDTRESPTEVNRFAKGRDLAWFKRNTIYRVPFGSPGFMRLVYPGFLQLAGFMAMNLERHVEAHWEMFQHLVEGDGEQLATKRAFYEEYRAVMDLAARFYLETVERVFHEHLLPRGLLTWRGMPVEPQGITRTALQTLEGTRDDITGDGQTHAAHRLCSQLPDSMREQVTHQGVGHYGLFNGRRFRETIAPGIKAFIRQHRAAPGELALSA